MIHNHNQNTRFRSITDCFYGIVVDEIKIFFNLLILLALEDYRVIIVVDSLGKLSCLLCNLSLLQNITTCTRSS